MANGCDKNNYLNMNWINRWASRRQCRWRTVL